VSVESSEYDFFSEGATTVIRKSSEATPTSFSSFFDSNRGSSSSLPERVKQFSNAHFRVTFASSFACPLLPKELEEKHSSDHIGFENALDKGIEITREDKKDEKAEFQFDAVFKPDSTQIQIFGEGKFLRFSSLISKSPFLNF
jgi:hypothetical protein